LKANWYLKYSGDGKGIRKESEMFMVFCVIDDPNKLDNTLVALEKGGIGGATIVESSGMHRHGKKRLPLPYLYAPMGADEMDNITIFMIVEDQTSVNKCQTILEDVLGDLNEPNTGIFAAWKLDVVKGVPGCGTKGDEHGMD